jgi:NADPH:quinone reductase-like Zn-dependent oxidoreductase
MGARVIGTSGSPGKLERLRAAGLDLGLCTRAPDFAEAVREATGGKGVDLAIDTVGGSVFAECVRCLGFEGRLAMVGYVDGVLKAELDLEALHSRRLTLFGVSNKLRTTAQRARTVAGFRAHWLPLFAEGRLRPIVDRVFGFDELPAAREAMEGNEHLGKLVLRVADGA